MNESKKISVIVPMFKAEDTLQKCVESITGQSYKNLEIILVDDGSPDKCPEMCDAFALSDNRIRVIHQENSGVSAARNAALDIASGDYISFVDSDDYIEKSMYENMMDAAYKYNADIITTNLMLISDGSSKIIKCNLESNKLYDREYIEDSVMSCFSRAGNIALTGFTNKLFSSDIFKRKEVRFNKSLCYQEDLLFMIEIFANTSSLVYLDENYYIYEPAAGGLYSDYRKNSFNMFLSARTAIFEVIKKYNIKNVDYLNLNTAFLYNITYYIYRTGYRVKDKQERKQLIDAVLTNSETISVCTELANIAVSFDRRIAKAISENKKKKALWLINFVFSGKKDRLLKLYSKIKK